MDKKREFLLNEIDPRVMSDLDLGEILGYPKCCIDEFLASMERIKRKEKSTDIDVMRLKAGYIDGVFTGFIPCAEHAKRIIDREITLSSLITDRNKNLKEFPNEFKKK